MNNDIRDNVSKCPTCRKYEVANPAEPLMVHEVSDRPWAKVGVDLFKFADRDYLCTVDYVSNFWEIDHLPSTQIQTVITKLKHHFARQGILDQVVTDNGPRLIARNFPLLRKSDVLHIHLSVHTIARQMVKLNLRLSIFTKPSARAGYDTRSFLSGV